MITTAFIYHLTLNYYNNTNCSIFIDSIDNTTGTCNSNQNNYECCDWISEEKNITLNNCENYEMWTCVITTGAKNSNDIYNMITLILITILSVLAIVTVCCAIFNKYRARSGYNKIDTNRINAADYTANDPYRLNPKQYSNLVVIDN